jgi:hypothetical protein
MTTIPKTALVKGAASGRYALTGFDEVDLWGRLNDPTWARLTLECGLFGLREEDKIRLLAVALLREKYGQL